MGIPLLSPPKITKKWLLIFLAIIFAIAATAAVNAAYVFEKKYEHRIAPGVYLKDYSLSGLTADEAEDVINRALDKITADGFKIVSKEQSFKVSPIVTSEVSPELSFRLIDFKSDEMAARALEYGHDKNPVKSLWKKLVLLARPAEIKPIYDVNKDALRKILKQKFRALEDEPRDAALIFDRDFSVSVSKEKTGMTIDYDTLIAKIRGRLDNLDLAIIAIYPTLTAPKINEADARSAIPEAEAILSLAPLAITYGEEKYTVSKKSLAEMLTLLKAGNATAVVLERENFNKYLDRLASYIEVKPQEPKLTLTGGKIADFTPPRDGLKIDREAAYGAFTKQILREKQKTAELPVNKTSPKTEVGDVNTLGIKEIVGAAMTSFAGSPKNRVENIRVGAKKLNGLIIQAGEIFSLLDALKPFDEENGYLPELVIKGDRTIPEFGGGLCQIGTTIFRTTLNSGLPILARQNHSYRVSYYEPPVGMDATIYDPSPDFKFKNNYKSALLIQAYIRGTNLIIEFWGTKDERKIDITKPQVYNVVQPPPKKEIQTEDLPVGKTKCTEKPHAGADAKFTYTVKFEDGTEFKKEFKSHYVPWQEVCLVGVPKGTLSASSTPNNIPLP
ncbi:MAG: VanW family protein [Patescibacteria group bacterium]